MKTIIEPFRIKMVEPIRLTTQDERQRLIKDVHYIHSIPCRLRRRDIRGTQGAEEFPRGLSDRGRSCGDAPLHGKI